MSTNSTIRINRADGTQTGIYCHWDGYVSGVGTILQLAYNTAEKVEELLKLGDLSSLGYYIIPEEGKEHSVDGERQEDVCLAYHRDRGEEFIQSDGDNEFIYTFDEKEAVWYVEEEQYVSDTKAQELLSMGSFWRKKKRLLLDAIICTNEKEYSYWKDDEFAKAGHVIEACIKKAQEARKEIVERQQDEYKSYYRAYCD